MAGRAELMDEINEVSFALNETTLYLDTHPDDQQALAYFNELAPRRKELLKEYAQSYEPLTLDCICGERQKNADHFVWTDGPAPWEGGANVCGTTKKDYSFL